MSSDSIVKSVAKELKYYCDVKRLEDGFDLSGINNYRVDNSVYPVVHNDHGPREEQVKRKIRKHMTNYHFLLSDPALPMLSKRSKSAKSKSKKSTKIPEYYYIYSARPQILPRSKTSLGGPVKSAKKRPKSVKNGWNQSKRNISEIMTKKETDRLVNAAAKLLVATETVESIDSARTPRPQTAPRSFEENRRPHTAKYTYDINGRKVFNTQLTYYDENHTRTKPKRSQSGRSPINRPGSPTPSENTSDDTYASSISVDDIQRLKTPAPPRPKTTAKRTRNRTYISDNKTPDEEEIAVSKTMQTQDNDTVGIQTENKLLEKYDHMEDEVKEGPFAEYQIFIQTGNTNGASTKSDAKLTLYGEKGRSKEFVLAESKNHKVKFQKGKEDYFMIAAHHVGKLRKIKIGHDRPELSYAWYLENITVSDMYDKRVYDLPCGRWLSGQNGDRNTYVYLPVQRDRAFIETLETSCESTKPREKSAIKLVSKTPNNNKEKKRGKSMEMKHVKSESDDGEYEDSVGAEKNSKKRPTNGRVSESSYTTSDSEEESYSESQTESESGQVISLKNSPVHKSKSQSRRVSNDSSNKANGPTFTFRSKDGGETKHTQDKNSPVKNSEDKMDSGSKKVVDKDYLLGYKAGLEAAQKENIKKREEQMDEEKKLLTKGQTIHEAAWNGNLERVKQLVEHFPEMKESKDGNGLVPLHKAVINGQTGVTKWLATCGVDLDIETPTSYTPMHLAALHGHVNVMMVLSALGASVKCATIEKQTPLHLAARGGHLECVKWLVANRADITGEDTFGRKPVYLAEEFEQDTVADFLRACEKELSNPNSGFALMYGSSIEGEVSQSPTPKVTDDKMSNVSDKGKAGSDDDEEEEEEEENTETVSTVDKTKIEERRKSYDEQHYKMTERGKSFLDSIRQDIEEDEEESNA